MATLEVEENEDGRRTERGTGKKGRYNHYSPKEKAQIGKYCLENGPSNTAKKFRSVFPNLNESSVRNMREQYKREMILRIQTLDSEEVTEIPTKRRGRPLTLGNELDNRLKNYIVMMKNTGAIVNTSIVKSVARGVVSASDSTLLIENGGTIDLTKCWARSFLHRINFFKRKCSSAASKADEVDNFETLKSEFLERVDATMAESGIAKEMVINWHYMDLNFVPTSEWTLEVAGEQRVEITGLGDKRKLTAVFAGTLQGEILPPQVIFSGKTTRCLPNFEFPDTWDIKFTENHRSNEETQLSYVDKIIIPFLEAKRVELGLPDSAKALCIVDTTQATDLCHEYLHQNNIAVVYIPDSCSDRLQPLELGVQKVIKCQLKEKFEIWYSRQIMIQIEKYGPDCVEPIELPLTVLKEQVSKWLVDVHEELRNQPDLIMNGFESAGILKELEDV